MIAVYLHVNEYYYLRNMQAKNEESMTERSWRSRRAGLGSSRMPSAAADLREVAGGGPTPWTELMDRTGLKQGKPFQAPRRVLQAGFVYREQDGNFALL